MKIIDCYDAIKNGDLQTVEKCIEVFNINPSYSFLATPVKDLGRSQNLLFWAAHYLGFIQEDKSLNNPTVHKMSQTPRWAILRAIMRSRELTQRPEAILTCFNSRDFNLLQDVVFKCCFLYNDQKLIASKAYYEFSKLLISIAKKIDGKLIKSKKSPSQDAIECLVKPARGKLSGKAHNLMHIACYFGVADVIDMLLTLHPDLSLKTESGLTALQLAVISACYSDHIDVPYTHDQEKDSIACNFRAERLRGIRLLVNYITNIAKLPFLLNDLFTGEWLTDYDKPAEKGLMGTIVKAGDRLSKRSTKIAIQYCGNRDSLLHIVAKALCDKPNQASDLITLIRNYSIDLSLLDTHNKTAYDYASKSSMPNQGILDLLKSSQQAPRHMRAIVPPPSNVAPNHSNDYMPLQQLTDKAPLPNAINTDDSDTNYKPIPANFKAISNVENNEYSSSSLIPRHPNDINTEKVANKKLQNRPPAPLPRNVQQGTVMPNRAPGQIGQFARNLPLPISDNNSPSQTATTSQASSALPPPPKQLVASGHNQFHLQQHYPHQQQANNQIHQFSPTTTHNQAQCVQMWQNVQNQSAVVSVRTNNNAHLAQNAYKFN